MRKWRSMITLFKYKTLRNVESINYSENPLNTFQDPVRW